MYGFTEGKWHGKRLRQCLRRHGYRIARRPDRADIVIAHSGGCLDTPILPESTILMLVNPPYWPGRHLLSRAHNMVLQLLRAVEPGNQPMFHITKTFRNLFYLFWHGATNFRMVRESFIFNLEDEVRHQRTILVRNENDPWLTPELDQLVQINPHVQIVRLPGDHDNMWLHPEPYVNLLQSD